MYRILSVLLLLSTLAAPSLCQRKRPGPAPRNVVKVKGVPATRSGTPSLTLPKVGITVEKYVSSYDIRSDGTANHVFEVQQKCSLATCLGRIASVKQEFNGDTHSMKLLEASIVKANGKKIDLPAAAGKVLRTPQAESAPGFSSMKQLELEFPGLAVGDSAQYKVELLTLKPVFGKNFDSIERFSLLFDWRSIEVNVTAPSDYPLLFDAPGLEGGPVASEGGRSRWQWKASDLKALEPEVAMVDPIAKSPRFDVTSFKSFEELGGYFGAAVREKAVITPEVRKLADEITAGLDTHEKQAAAIYQWVNKNVRYLLVVLDFGGWVPHSTTEILKNGYGDCKDYTTLIYALLKAKGIESTPALINADFGNWFPRVPVKSYFNHAVLYVPSLKLFADATAPNTRLGIIPQPLIGKTALLSSEKSGLIEVPKNDPESNQVSSEAEIELAENGDLKAVSKSVFTGRSEIALRPMFGDKSRYLPSDTLVKILLAFYGINGTGRILSMSDPHAAGEPFVLSMEVSIPDYTTFLAKGSVAIPIGLNMSNLGAYEMFAKDEKRSTDLMVGATRLREKYRIKLPAKATPGSLPTPVKVSNAAGHFSSTFTLADGGVELVRELVIAKDWFTPAEYPLFKELMRQTVESLNSAVAYTSDPKLLNTKTAVKAKSSAVSSRSGLDAVYSVLTGGADQGVLPPAQVRRLEARIAATADDTDTRIRLVRHYISYEVRETPAVAKARLTHRLWFVRNRPEVTKYIIYGIFGRPDSKESGEYQTLRDEWLRQVAADKNNKAIRLNAMEFVEEIEPEVAKKILSDGRTVDAAAYEFPFHLARLVRSEIDAPDKKLDAEQRSKLNREVLEYGRIALVLIKKERSSERDSDRGELLVNLVRIAVQERDLQLAESLGRELVIDFGSDINSAAYSEGSHIGNIALGTVELSRGNVEKAAEHLLVSIKAPLRNTRGYFTNIDFSLAKDLFRKGDRKTVVEFLKNCLELDSFKSEPEVYDLRIKAIREWLAQAEKGVEPSFDFEKTAAKK